MNKTILLLCPMEKRMNFSDFEKQVLVNLMKEPFASIIKNKVTNAIVNRQKHEAWEKLTKLYNATPNVSKRSMKQLMNLHRNMKKKALQNLAVKKMERLRTACNIPSIMPPPTVPTSVATTAGSVKDLQPLCKALSVRIIRHQPLTLTTANQDSAAAAAPQIGPAKKIKVEPGTEESKTNEECVLNSTTESYDEPSTSTAYLPPAEMRPTNCKCAVRRWLEAPTPEMNVQREDPEHLLQVRQANHEHLLHCRDAEHKQMMKHKEDERKQVLKHKDDDHQQHLKHKDAEHEQLLKHREAEYEQRLKHREAEHQQLLKHKKAEHEQLKRQKDEEMAMNMYRDQEEM